MPALDLVDETFVVAAPGAVAAVVRDPDRWPRWWPDLQLTVFQDRGDAGVRWNVRGALTGSMEVWLEACKDGVLLHHYVRCDRSDGRPVSPRERRRRQTHAKTIFWALKDELEGDRAPGLPRSPADVSDDTEGAGQPTVDPHDHDDAAQGAAEQIAARRATQRMGVDNPEPPAGGGPDQPDPDDQPVRGHQQRR